MKENFVKIINETYKIIDFFPDSDPLKNKAKEKTLAIMENLTLISDARGWVSLKKEKASAELLDDIEILENYLKLGKYQGWIDNINLLIITKEYNIIKGQINPPKGLMGQNLSLQSGIPSAREIVSNIKESIMVEGIRQAEDSIKSIDKTALVNKNSESGAIKKLSERQEKILQILSEKEKAQVSDIIKEIPKVTKRTIRRDLDDLLKKGKILRVGEWNQVFYQLI